MCIFAHIHNIPPAVSEVVEVIDEAAQATQAQEPDATDEDLLRSASEDEDKDEVISQEFEYLGLWRVECCKM
jgi:hypothetical protein